MYTRSDLGDHRHRTPLTVHDTAVLRQLYTVQLYYVVRQYRTTGRTDHYHGNSEHTLAQMC